MTIKMRSRAAIVHVFTATAILLAAISSSTVSSSSSSTAAAFVGRTANNRPHRYRHAAVVQSQHHQQRGCGFLAAARTDTVTLSNLAKEWSALNSDHDNNNVVFSLKKINNAPAPVVSSSSAAAAGSKSNSEKAMDELSKAWASLNQDTDAIQYPNINKKKAGSLSSAAVPVAAVALAAPQQQPTTSDYGRLATEWAVINKDTDTMKHTPPIVALAAAPLVPSMSLSITSETAQSMVQAAKDKWEEMSAELAEIIQEAEQTFAALNEMEQATNDTIQKMQLRESDHQERYAALQQSSTQRQDELLQKIDYITKDYEMFKRDALLAQQASAQQAAACQSQLQHQISQLQHDLQSKVQLLQQESTKAQYYMNAHEQTQQELNKTKQNFEQERLAMNQEQIESTHARIQMLRSVNANLRHMSSGSRAIMERMRIKLQCLDGI